MNFPTAAELTADLNDLLGVDVNVSPGSVDASTVGHSTYEFVDDNDTPVCVVSTELPLAHGAGAALAMMPAGRVDGDAPDEELLEFYREVVNVLSGRVNLKNDVHVRLVPGSDGAGSWPGGGNAACYEVSLGDYGVGNIGFVAV
jgi:hypothetical protein